MAETYPRPLLPTHGRLARSAIIVLAALLALGAAPVSAYVRSPRASASAPGVEPGAIRGLGTTSQLIEVTTSQLRTTVASARVYSRIVNRWHEVRGPVSARIGYGGLSWPGSRREGDGTTPIGDYGFVYDFGSRPDPGVTGFAWRALRPGACWSQTSYDYNRWIDRIPCPAADEDLWASALGAYRYAAVIDFNYFHPVYPRGSGIFLHEQTGGPTAGCISLAEPDLLFVLRWMRPGARILIGPSSWLRSLTAAGR